MKLFLLAATSLFVLSLRAAAADPIVLKDLPDIYRLKFKSDPYIAAAAALQKMGEKEAGDTLARLAEDGKYGDRIIVLCRMLYVAKPKGDFRSPMLGVPVCHGGTEQKNWPLAPIEIVDGVPFLVVRGYFLAGVPEPPVRYLKYCRENCDWSSQKFTPKTPAEKKKALDSLLARPIWKDVLTQEEKDLLASQVE